MICADDFNFIKSPKSQVFSRFIEPSFDILFRFDLEPKFEIDVILLSAKTKMYAGAQNDKIPYVDFGIDLSKNAGLNGLSKNLIEYLNSLNSTKFK